MNISSHRFTIDSTIFIDELGRALRGPEPISHSEIGQQALYNLYLDKKCYYKTLIDNSEYLVLPFSEPLVIQSLKVDRENKKIWLHGPYQTLFDANLKSFCLDHWDQIHGMATKGNIDFYSSGVPNLGSLNQPPKQISILPFILSRPAQRELFDQIDEFNDDFLSFDSYRIPTPTYYSNFTAATEEAVGVSRNEFWNDLYLKAENPGWNLLRPAPAFVAMTPRLKLPKSKILVLGCGEGHDAAYFAREGGHLVKAVDFSTEAIRRAQALYGNLSNLEFIQADVFCLPDTFYHQFDLVIEHTLYCAIPPSRRPELVKVWRKLLAPRGMLMGVFFTMEKRQGPPFGTSEFEIREYLRKDFRFLLWNRLENSVETRQHLETFVLAQLNT